MIPIFEYLSSSKVVASAQKYFGIEAINCSSNSIINGNSNTIISNGIKSQSTNNVTYKIHNYFLYYLFAVGANLGNEVFYISFLPFCFWSVDASVARQLCIHWCIFMYVGQATKDWLKIPRPLSPPVVHLEDRYCLEYGMPSTHAMVAAGFPFAIYLLTLNRYLLNSLFFSIFALIWCLVICGSRIYLGMHSFLDVIAGIIYSILIITITQTIFLANFEYIIFKTKFGIPLIILSPIILLYIYPKTPYWKSTKGDTAIILGVTAGLLLSFHILDIGGFIIETVEEKFPYQIVGFGFQGFMVGSIRSIIGLGILIGGRFICKKFSEFLVLKILNEKKCKSETSKVEIPRKFLTYFLLAIIGFVFVPLLLKSLNLHRESYFAEFSD